MIFEILAPIITVFENFVRRHFSFSHAWEEVFLIDQKEDSSKLGRFPQRSGEYLAEEKNLPFLVSNIFISIPVAASREAGILDEQVPLGF